MTYINQIDTSLLQLDPTYIKLSNNVLSQIEEPNYEKKRKYYQLLNKWMINRENNRKIEQIFIEMGIRNIAIYGMGDLGKHLLKELENSMINVFLCFDKRTEFLYMDEPLKYINDNYANIDAVIVTPFLEYKDIRLFLKQFFDVPIMSLEELISECEIL